MAHENIYKLNYVIQIIYVWFDSRYLSGYSHNGIIQDRMPGFLTGSPPWTARIEQWQLSTSPLTVVHAGVDHLHDGGGTWTKSRKRHRGDVILIWECNNLCMIFSVYFLRLLILYIIIIIVIMIIMITIWLLLLLSSLYINYIITTSSFKF